MLGLGQSMFSPKKAVGVVRKDLQLWHKYNESNAPYGEDIVENGTFNLGADKVVDGTFDDTTVSSYNTGKALSFGGSSWVSGMSALDGYVVDSNASFTIATTFKATTLGQGMIFSTGQDGSNRCYLWTNSDTLYFSWGDQSGNPTTGTMPNVSVGTTYRVVISVSGLTSTVYLDGEEVYTKTASTDFTLEDELTLGRHGSQNGFYYNGLISDVEFFDSAWTSSDVTFDYNNPNHLVTDNPNSTIALSNLKGYWALNEGSGSIAFDSSEARGGSELQTNDFSTDTTGWGATSATLSVSNNELINTSNGVNPYGIAVFSAPLSNSKSYVVEGYYRNIDATSAYVAFYDGLTQTTIASANSSTTNVYFKATITSAASGNPQLKFNSSSTVGQNLSVAFSNVSIKEVSHRNHGAITNATYVDSQPTIPQLGMMDWSKGNNLLTYSFNILTIFGRMQHRSYEF